MCSLCVPLSVGFVPALRQGVVRVFSVCAPVCWSCAGITSGGSSCVLSVCPCLLVLCRHYVRGEFLCSLCVPLSVGLVPALRQGVVHVFVVCTPVCWSCAGITSGWTELVDKISGHGPSAYPINKEQGVCDRLTLLQYCLTLLWYHLIHSL